MDWEKWREEQDALQQELNYQPEVIEQAYWVNIARRFTIYTASVTTSLTGHSHIRCWQTQK